VAMDPPAEMERCFAISLAVQLLAQRIVDKSVDKLLSA
jgi:hypothetical protein